MVSPELQAVTTGVPTPRLRVSGDHPDLGVVELGGEAGDLFFQAGVGVLGPVVEPELRRRQPRRGEEAPRNVHRDHATIGRERALRQDRKRMVRQVDHAGGRRLAGRDAHLDEGVEPDIRALVERPRGQLAVTVDPKLVFYTTIVSL